MDSLVITGLTSKSIPLNITGLELFVVPIKTVVGCGVAITIQSASDFLKENRENNLKIDKFKKYSSKFYRNAFRKVRR